MNGDNSQARRRGRQQGRGSNQSEYEPYRGSLTSVSVAFLFGFSQGGYKMLGDIDIATGIIVVIVVAYLLFVAIRSTWYFVQRARRRRKKQPP